VGNTSHRTGPLSSRTQDLVIALRALLTQKASHIGRITDLVHKVCARVLANAIRNRTCRHCIFIED
jgi:hypothetical protein